MLPFRVNQYVIDELIDWDDAPDDPMFRLVFPQPEMLAPEHFSRIADLLQSDADKEHIQAAAREIRTATDLMQFGAPAWLRPGILHQQVTVRQYGNNQSLYKVALANNLAAEPVFKCSNV